MKPIIPVHEGAIRLGAINTGINYHFALIHIFTIQCKIIFAVSNVGQQMPNDIKTFLL
jgi:hypothetical protein